MTIALTTTVSNTAGLAEDFADIVYDISPTDTPYLTMAKKIKAQARIYQWQEDTLAAAAANAQQEGDVPTYATAAQTTSLSSPLQIATKQVNISATLDVVKKYGRKSEVAFQIAKRAKELKRDVEYALVRNQASVTTTARATGGFECWIQTGANLVAANSGQTADYTVRGFSSGSVIAPAEDGSLVTFIEADLKTALGYAWTDGGDASVIMMSPKNKAQFDGFSGVATKYREVTGNNQAAVVGASDIYISLKKAA